MKYIQVRDYLRALVTHELKVADAIPSERELCERFGVSRMTVRQAVDALVVEGLLDRVQGKGTFVARPKVDLQVRLASFGDEMRRRGLSPSSRMVSAEVQVAPHDVAEMLNLAKGEQVYYLYRVRLADGEPMALEQTWIPTHLAPGFFDPVPPESVYGALTSRGLKPEWGEDTVDADEASVEEAGLLGIEPLRAVLRIARRTFSGDVAIEYARSAYRADRYTLWVPVATPRPSLAPPSRVDIGMLSSVERS